MKTRLDWAGKFGEVRLVTKITTLIEIKLYILGYLGFGKEPAFKGN